MRKVVPDSTISANFALTSESSAAMIGSETKLLLPVIINDLRDSPDPHGSAASGFANAPFARV